MKSGVCSHTYKTLHAPDWRRLTRTVELGGKRASQLHSYENMLVFVLSPQRSVCTLMRVSHSSELSFCFVSKLSPRTFTVIEVESTLRAVIQTNMSRDPLCFYFENFSYLPMWCIALEAYQVCCNLGHLYLLSNDTTL